MLNYMHLAVKSSGKTASHSIYMYMYMFYYKEIEGRGIPAPSF
jgi:hypothetical protein